MIVDTKKIEIESNIDASNEKTFGVADLGFIFDILRNKLYSNKIESVSREVCSNCVDANTESGNKNVPIEITLPNALSPKIIFKDSGVGISEDRIANIVVNYGASTKRNSNEFVGFFGIGFKSPYCIADLWNIKTTVDGYTFEYAAYIDETKVGKLSLLSKVPSTGPTGTEVSIPVAPKDFDAFKKAIESVCRYYPVKPIIHGGSIDWQTPKPEDLFIEGAGWKIFTSNNSYYQSELDISLGGVRYSLGSNDDFLYSSEQYRKISSIRGKIVLYFDIGQLSVSASRESLQLDDKTTSALNNRFAEIFEHIKAKLQAKIDEAPTFFDANINYYNIANSFSGFLYSDGSYYGKNKPQVFWKGHALVTNGVSCPLYGVKNYKRSANSNYSKAKSHHSASLLCSATSKFFINDFGDTSSADYKFRDLTSKQIQALFETYPDMQSIQIVSAKEFENNSVLSTYKDLLPFENLSNVIDDVITQEDVKKLVFYKFDAAKSNFNRCSFDTIKNDTKTKLFTYIKRDAYNKKIKNALINNKQLNCNIISCFQKTFSNYSIYAVEQSAVQENKLVTKKPKSKNNSFSRFETIFKNVKDLGEFIEQNFPSDLIIQAQLNNYASEFSDHFYYSKFDFLDSIKSKLDKSHDFYKYYELNNTVSGMLNDNRTFSNLLHMLNSDGDKYKQIQKTIHEKPVGVVFENPKELYNKILKKYPLIKGISSYKVDSNDILDYIRMVDFKESVTLKNSLKKVG